MRCRVSNFFDCLDFFDFFGAHFSICNGLKWLRICPKQNPLSALPLSFHSCYRKNASACLSADRAVLQSGLGW